MMRSRSSKAVVSSYTDPLIELLHSADLNKTKELSNTLVSYIDDIDDIELRKWCIDSLTVLRNLEKIETQLDQWEFHTLDFTIELGNQNSKDTSVEDNIMRGNLAKRVLEKSNAVRKLLSGEKNSINTSIKRARNLTTNSPALVVTDAGTILVELTMRIVKLAKLLDQQVTIGYSRARLTIIGSELKKLVTKNPFLIDKEVAKNYEIFVNNLLNQLNSAAAHNDTVGLWESVKIVGDVQKMFESMKRKAMPEKPEKSNHDEQIKEQLKKQNFTSSNNINSSTIGSSHNKDGDLTDSTLVDYDIEKSVSKLSAKEIFHNDDELIRTQISDHIPELMAAFKKNENTQSSAEPLERQSNHSDDDSEEKEKQMGGSGVSSGNGINVPNYSLFRPSILNAFYKPKLKEPIYINKSNVIPSEEADRPDSNGKQTQNKENCGIIASTSSLEDSMFLTNASMAVRLDKMAQENEAQSVLLDKERELRDKEILANHALMKNTRPIVSTSPLLQHLSSSMMSKSIIGNFKTEQSGRENDNANLID